MNLHDLDEVINALLAGSAEQSKKIANLDKRLSAAVREIERLSKRAGK